MKKHLLALIAVLFSISVSAQEDDFEIGKRYYDNNDYHSAFTFFQKAANNGDHNAQYFLGMMYLEGAGIPTDNSKAFAWIQRAAEQENMYAQNQLGQMFYSGTGVQKDINIAITWIIKSADQGYDVAQYNLGYIYCYAMSETKKAFFWFQKAAYQGNAYAQNELGVIYYAQEDYENALIWLNRSAEQDNAESQMRLGRMYMKGIGVNQDFFQAYDWLSKSANQGNSEAQVGLGYLFLNGDGVNQDYIKALEWFKKSADQGNSQAAQALGIMYYNGTGINKDDKLAFGWFTKGTEGLPIINNDSKYYLGLMYFKGQGVNQDYKMAAKWFLDAADFGDPRAQYRLAKMYFEGKGVKQDYTSATKWMTKAAEEKNYANAQYALGVWHYKGEGVKKNYQKAEQWFRKATEHNNVNPLCYGYLAKINAEFHKNFTEAYKYADMAIEICYSESKERQAIVFATKGSIALLEGDINKAQSIYKYCIDLDPMFALGKSKFAKDMAKLNNNGVDSNIIINPSNNKSTFAIIIGNEKYRNAPDVPFATNDAKIFCEYVEKTLGVPHEQIKYVEDATYNDMRISTNWLIQAMTICRGEGKGIVYYAGHGIPNESDMSAYLLPVDGIANDTGSAYSLKELYDKLGSVDAQSITIFLDACFSGSKREEGMLTSARGVAIKSKPSTPKGNMIVFLSAQGDETAYPYKDKQHGMFTYFLLRKLQETKGNVTLGELSDYLSKEVRRESFVKNGKMQTPTTMPSINIENNWRNMKLR